MEKFPATVLRRPEIPDLAAAPPVSQAKRIGAATIVAALVFLYTMWTARRDPSFVSDFDQIWVASRALLSSANPYHAVATVSAAHGPLRFPLFYPLPAIIAGVPLALLPMVTARAVFAAASVGLLAYLMSARGLWTLAALLSAPAFQTVSLVQWSGWLACAAMVPWLGWVYACKPNAGLSICAASRSTRDIVVALFMAGTLTLIAFAVQPSWVSDWLAAIRGQPHFKPYVLRPGGFLLLLGLLRWRRPEARWLVATACVPGTPGLQEALVFFTWPLSFRQILVLGLLSHGAMWAAFLERQHGDFQSFVKIASVANIIFIFVPALFIVLRKPNEGPTPKLLELTIDRLKPRRR